MLIGAAIGLLGIHFSRADEAKPMLRVVCATALSEHHKIVIASRDEDGKWKSISKVELNSAIVSDWLPAEAGTLHIAEKKDREMKSIGHFTYPEGTNRATVTLIANKEKKIYDTHAFNPEKEGFVKGASLILNLSKHTANVRLGTGKLVIEAAKHLATKPTTDENGGYHMIVSYPDANGAEQLCCDRMAITSPNARNIVFLLPDEAVGLRVMTLSEFGPFE
jgi:hypothetical protein